LRTDEMEPSAAALEKGGREEWRKEVRRREEKEEKEEKEGRTF